MKIPIRQLGFSKFVKVNIGKKPSTKIYVRDDNTTTLALIVQNADHTISELVFADLKEVNWVGDTMNVKVTV